MSPFEYAMVLISIIIGLGIIGLLISLERLITSCESHLRQGPKQALHGILSDVLRFKGRVNQRDDITMLVVKRGQSPDSATS